jgi:hypothetical protein
MLDTAMLDTLSITTAHGVDQDVTLFAPPGDASSFSWI